MPSHLRIQSFFEPFTAETTRSVHPSAIPPAKKQKMSLSQTYCIAASARSKLTHEAQKSDHDLRLLVGHANLLDSLMLVLADAEREQEAWFNQTVNNAAHSQQKHIQWVDTIDEEVMDDYQDDEYDSSDSDSDYDEAAQVYDMIPRLHGTVQVPVVITTTEVHADDDDDDDDDEEDDDDDDDDEDYVDDEFDEAHALSRTPSQQHPPELVHEEDSDSDEEPPTTPPQPAALEYSEKERQAITTTAFYDRKDAALISDDYIIPQPNVPMIAIC